MTCNHDSLWAENGRLKALLKARTDALNRTVDKVTRVEHLLKREHPGWDEATWIRRDAIRAALDAEPKESA